MAGVLEQGGRRRFIAVGGSPDERLQAAIAAIEPLLTFPPLFLPPPSAADGAAGEPAEAGAAELENP